MTEEDASKELESNLGKMREIVSDLKAMVASSGWKYYSTMMEEQKVMRQNRILLTPLETHDQVLAQEYMKGEYAALALAERLIPEIVESFEARLASQTGEEDDEQSA